MKPFGITITKETQLFARRSKKSEVIENLRVGTSLLYVEVKYREGDTWK